MPSTLVPGSPRHVTTHERATPCAPPQPSVVEQAASPMPVAELVRADFPVQRRSVPRIEPTDPVLLDTPPELSPAPEAPLLRKLLPLVMVVAVVGIVVLMVVSGQGSSPMTYLFPLLMLASMLGMAGGNKNGNAHTARRTYLAGLRSARARVHELIRQRHHATWNIHPPANALWLLIGTTRMWERTASDPDFCHLRLGTSTQPNTSPAICTALGSSDELPADLDPLCAHEAHALVCESADIHRSPQAIALTTHPVVHLTGADAWPVARAVLAQLIVFHGPDVVALATPQQSPHTLWATWLPHTRTPRNTRDAHASPPGASSSTQQEKQQTGSHVAHAVIVIDANVLSANTPATTTAAELLLLATRADSTPALAGSVSSEAIWEELGEDISHASRRTIILIDPEHRYNLSAYRLHATHHHLRIIPAGNPGAAASTASETSLPAITTDHLSPDAMDLLARRMARYTRSSGSLRSSLNAPSLLERILGWAATWKTITPGNCWEYKTGRERLSVHLGERITPPTDPDSASSLSLTSTANSANTVAAAGRPSGMNAADGEPGAGIVLDLKESAHGGYGPHGLCIGATGSGKSELLRTIVLGLVTRHSPEQLNLVLVDFKGGATFAGCESAPHVAAVITNLENEALLVERMYEVLSGELTRRQEFLRAHHAESMWDYETRRRRSTDNTIVSEGEPTEPMPSLVIIIDEFSELLSAHPEFIDLFVAIGRLGRSLGVHLLLATQRLDEGKMRGLESHLSYRICLRTFSAAESRAVIGIPDAYSLPREPGYGIVRWGEGDCQYFRAAYVGGRISTEALTSVDIDTTPVTADRNMLSHLLHLLGNDGPHHHEVTRWQAARTMWLPPLPNRLTYSTFMKWTPDDAVIDRESGNALIDVGAGQPNEPNTDDASTQPCVDIPLPVPEQLPLQPVIGVIDVPRDQAWYPWRLDLRGAHGHVAVVGAAQTGVSTTLRTIMMALAHAHTPQQVSFYIADMAGGAMAAMESLPHTAAVVHSQDSERLQRLFTFLTRELERRRTLWIEQRWASLDEGRAHGVPDLFLVIDGWHVLHRDFPDIADLAAHLITDALQCGIHVMVGTRRWTELRPAVRDQLGTKIELRLGDSMDSVIDRRASASIPTAPGRSIVLASSVGIRTAPTNTNASLGSTPRPDVLHSLILATHTADLDAMNHHICTPRQDTPTDKLPELPAYLGWDTLTTLIETQHIHLPDTVTHPHLTLGVDSADLNLATWNPEFEPSLCIVGAPASGKTTTLRTILTSIYNTYDGCHEHTDGRRHRTPTAAIVTMDPRRNLLGIIPETYSAGYASSTQGTEELLQQLVVSCEQRLPPDNITPVELKQRSWWSGPDIYLIIDNADMVTAPAGVISQLCALLPYAADIGLRLILTRSTRTASRAMHEPLMQALRGSAHAALVLPGERADGPLFGATLRDNADPGRAWYVTAGRQLDIQVVDTPEAELSS